MWGVTPSPFIYRLARWLTFFRVLACWGVCVNYVICSHLQRRASVGLAADRLMAAVILGRLVSVIAASRAPYGVVASVEGAVECLSLVSLAASTSWCHFGFLQAYIMLLRFRQLEQEGLSFNVELSVVARSVVRLVLQFVVFVFIFASGLQMAELLGDPSEVLAATSFEMTWVNALYMSCVTITTVGYGDFVPYTLMGRIWVLAVILSGAFLVAQLVSSVLAALAAGRRGTGTFTKSTPRHVILCGNIKWEFFVQFVMELYAIPSVDEPMLVVLHTAPFGTEGDQGAAELWNGFVHSAAVPDRVRYKLVYLEGDATAADALHRARVGDASAVFVLCNQHSEDTVAEDSATLKRVLTIRALAPAVPVYAMVALRDSMLQISFALSPAAGRPPPRRGQAGRLRRQRRVRRGPPKRPRRRAVVGSAAVDNSRGDGPSASTTSASDVLRPLPAERVPSGTGGSSQTAFLPWSTAPSRKSLQSVGDVSSGMGGGGGSGSVSGADGDGGGEAWSSDGSMDQSTPLPSLPSSSPTSPSVSTHSSFSHWSSLSSRGSSSDSSGDERFTSFDSINVPDVAAADSAYPMPVPSAAQLSEAVCMQEVEMGLLAENVFCNGLSTLLCNLCQRVRPPADAQLPSTDAMWMHEYRLGSECHFGFCAVPDDLDGVAMADVAVVLYDLGIVLLAVRHEQRLGLSPPRWATVAPSTVFRRGDTAIAITYLEDAEVAEQFQVAASAHCAPMPSYSADDGSTTGSGSMLGPRLVPPEGPPWGAMHPATPGIRVAGEQSPDDDEDDFGGMSMERVAEEIVSLPSAIAALPQDALHRVGRASLLGQSAGGGDRGGGGGDGSAVSGIHQDADVGPMHADSDTGGSASTSSPSIVMAVTVDPSAPRDGGRAPRTPVVAVSAAFTAADEAALSKYDKSPLFLVRGNSMAIPTLRRAQYGSAKAILILACEARPHQHASDSRALFTVMTLDHLLTTNSSVFVCCMLDAEASMALLRAPANPRRQGTTLGEHTEPAMTTRTPAVFSWARVPSGLPSPAASFVGSLPRTYSGLGYASASAPGVSSSSVASPGPYSGGGGGGYAYASRTPMPSGRDESDAYRHLAGGLSSASLFNSALYGGASSTWGGSQRNLRFDGAGIPVGGSGIGVGAYAGASGTLGADTLTVSAHAETRMRQRYASGEVLLSSALLALAVREAETPGLMAAVRTVFGVGLGTRARSTRCWIRALPVPRSWLYPGADSEWGGTDDDSSHGDDFGGSPSSRVYRDLFEALLPLGALPLGLYRAGDAVFRMRVTYDEPGGLGGERSSSGSQRGSSVDWTPASTAAHSRRGSASTLSPASHGGSGGESSNEAEPVLSSTDERGFRRLGRSGTSGGGVRSGRLGTAGAWSIDHHLEVMEAQLVREGGLGLGGHALGSDAAGGPADARDHLSGDEELPPLGYDEYDDEEELGEEIEDGDLEGAGGGAPLSYVCPTSGNVIYYQELPSPRDNRLPYVYTNPEPFTLLSPLDAVYVLVHPETHIPDRW
eukprot:contig_8839_g2090